MAYMFLEENNELKGTVDNLRNPAKLPEPGRQDGDYFCIENKYVWKAGYL